MTHRARTRIHRQRVRASSATTPRERKVGPRGPPRAFGGSWESLFRRACASEVQDFSQPRVSDSALRHLLTPSARISEHHLSRRRERMCAPQAVSYTHLRAHETPEHLVCRLLLEKKK